MAIPSNADVQRSFEENGLGPVESFVECYPVHDRGYYQVYSLPFGFDLFQYVSSGYNRRHDFSRVTKLMIYGYASFEHEHFMNIAEDFPRLVELGICNSSPQKLKNQQRTIDVVPVITFPRLKQLILRSSHIDFLEQFLVDRITRLPFLQHLEVCFDDLLTITDNFTNDASRLNCSQVNRFMSYESVARPASFFAYFPRL